jgi:hypothetical protein
MTLPPVTIAPPAQVPPSQTIIPLAIASPVAIPASPRTGFPQYLLFAPGQNTPTEGVLALSGGMLPLGVSGLIIRINRDSVRHFEGRPGTANISIPVATLSTFRFGLYLGRYTRPRAEFELRIRYLGDERTLLLAPTTTNIMAYGFIPGESGHGDVRMLVPASVRDLASQIRGFGMAMPEESEFALLEWPTTNETRDFRLSFIERGTVLYSRAEVLFQAAADSGALIGGGACWLPSDFAPEW